MMRGCRGERLEKGVGRRVNDKKVFVGLLTLQIYTAEILIGSPIPPTDENWRDQRNLGEHGSIFDCSAQVHRSENIDRKSVV